MSLLLVVKAANGCVFVYTGMESSPPPKKKKEGMNMSRMRRFLGGGEVHSGAAAIKMVP